MDITAISDLHGHYPELEGGDLLIVAGDLTRTDTIEEHSEFSRWLWAQKYKKKVFIAGNHDNILAGPWPGNTKGPFREDKTFYDFDYLSDSGTEFEGLKIWGSPWVRSFEGMNSKCKAFTLDAEEELAEKWKLIPDDIDILITHSPPFGTMDKIKNSSKEEIEFAGSGTLAVAIMDRPKIKMCVFGHIHESYGIKDYRPYGRVLVNASHVNELYEAVNKPIRIIL
jgi:Icc-related predicted phosphoesterase